MKVDMTVEKYINLFKTANFTKQDWDNLKCVWHSHPMVIPHENDGPLLVLCPPYVEEDIALLNEEPYVNQIRESLSE